MKTYRVGLLGFGFIGKVHAYGHLNLPLFYDPAPLRTRITHVVTGREETARQACAILGAETASTDFRAVTENPDIDIVHICTPNDRHHEALLSAMRAQKHIYCDKPLTATWAEAQDVAAALSGYRGTAQMTFQNRFFPATQRAKQLLDEGALGQVLTFRAAYLHGGSASPSAPLKWKLSRAAGGGVIADLASHVLDLVEWLLGPLAALNAATHVAFPRRPRADAPDQTAAVDAEDHVMLLARLPSGAVGTLEATKIASGTEDELRVEIHGSRGALSFNGMHPHFLRWHDATADDQPHGGFRGWNEIAAGQRFPPPAAAFPSPKAATGWLRAHVACLANFLQAVAQQRPASPGLDQGLRVQRLMEAVRASAHSGRWIDLPAE